MNRLILVKHGTGAPGLRILGLGPHFLPTRGLFKLKNLFDKYAFWAKGRQYSDLRQLLRGSSVVVSLWKGQRIVAFGRATSDGRFRAVFWDIVVADDLQGQGLGRKVVEALLNNKSIKQAERIYLMTSNRAEFYEQMGFEKCNLQTLLIKSK